MGEDLADDTKAVANTTTGAAPMGGWVVLDALEGAIVGRKFGLEQNAASQGVDERVNPTTARHEAASNNPIGIRNVVTRVGSHAAACEWDREHGVDDRVQKHGARSPNQALGVALLTTEVTETIAALIVKQVPEDPNVEQERAKLDDEDPSIVQTQA